VGQTETIKRTAVYVVYIC